MPPDDPRDGGAVPVVSIPEIRDYARINAELAQHLDAGHRRVRLVGAEGQRLLVAGLAGPWDAAVEVEGDAGPELAADLDAPGLTVVCRGSAADGAGRGLHAGRLLILGRAGDAIGYTQAGGTIVVAGPAGHRAGLAQAGGTLLLLGPTGRLPGERQSGGLLIAFGDRLGSLGGHGRRGGRLVVLAPDGEAALPEDRGLVAASRAILDAVAPWLPAGPA